MAGTLSLPTDAALSSASKADLVVALEEAQANEALPLAIEVPLTNVIAGSVAYADARHNDGDTVKVAVAAVSGLGAVLAGDENPGVRAICRAAAIGATNAISANAGRAMGLKHKAEAERRRAEQRTGPAEEPKRGRNGEKA
ncbi:uncharacterized protein SOCE26_040150 [Sorangium cellulosum]|uniref:Uncharacterized protein n=1 Tax=Sorangium cellulosum TaxID=56 RepID=A0A2L0ETI2_SORCE|nr:hypothetical protein [Sorangium cellulosum]AUX42582.1 uncharacterized protein SOCE26_040150 [Sorangium cellulosum]